MSPSAFGAWSLVLQLGAYVSYLDFGIQTAVARFVAHANERTDSNHRDRIVSTSLAILSISGVLAWCGALLVSAFLPHLFKQLPPDLLNEVRIAVLLVAGSLAVGLPASVFIGIFVGIQRNAIPAAIIGVSKLLSAVLVVLIVRHGGGLIQMAAAVAVMNLLSYALQYYGSSRVAPDVHISWRLVDRSAARELANYCLSLTVWSMGLLLVTGLDLSIVGYYRFNEVAYYAIAATVVTFLGGFYNAIMSPLMPAAAVLHARGDSRELGNMVMVTTRYGMLLLLAAGLPLIVSAHLILRVWVGGDYASHTTSIVQILVAATIIRLCVTPYTVAMIGSGEQRLIILTPILEGVSNLVCSLVAGYFLGALGVALGTLIGAIVGVLGMLFYNMRRTTAIQLTRLEYIKNSLFRPVLCVAPLIILSSIDATGIAVPILATHALQIAAGCTTIFMFWMVGLRPQERHALVNKMLSKAH
jgi:O-antigen/teichoic acid export membrane protein